MLMMGVGLIIIVLAIGITTSVGYYFAHNTAKTLQADLRETTKTLRISAKILPGDDQNKLKKIVRSSAIDITAANKNYKHAFIKLRTAYEQQVAQFQSSINQINGRMVANQDAYLIELKRLRLVYTSLQQRHIKLESLMDSGWAPRMVTIPADTQNMNTGTGEYSLQGIEENIGKRIPKKNSALSEDTLFSPTASPSLLALKNPTSSLGGSTDIASLKSAMQEHWKKQNLTSAQISFSARKRVKEMRQTLSRLKFKLSKLKLASQHRPRGNTGGPYVKLDLAVTGKSKDMVNAPRFAASQPFQQIFMLEKALLEMPIRRPLSDLRSITSPFGPRMDPFRKLYAMHRGIDFQAPEGEPVLATAAGVVVLIENNSKTGYGKLLVIRHEHGMTSLYGHLSEFSVSVGDRVKPGDVVGKVGNTGRSTGPHLHYEIRVDDSHVDPIDYLEAASHVF